MNDTSMMPVQDPGQSLPGGRRQDGIIQDINRHAAVVMEGLPGSDNQQQTAEEVAQAVRLARQVSSPTYVSHTRDCMRQ